MRVRDEQGFTLVELMIVVMIIGILIAIALPTFLGARTRAQDRAAQSGARNAMSAAKVLYTDTGDYSTTSVANLTTAEASLTYLAAAVPSTGPNRASVDTSVALDEVAFAVMSESGTCFYLHDTPTGMMFGTSPVAAACTGTDALGAAGTSW